MFIIRKKVGMETKLVSAMEKYGLDYTVRFDSYLPLFGEDKPVYYYFGVPLDENRAMRLIDDLVTGRQYDYSEEETEWL